MNHGLTHHPLYHTWKGMLRRCYNQDFKSYKDYGGRGIQVCERWQGDGGLANFIADMGEKPEDTYSLERKNNDGDYCKENCCWATKNDQALNRKTQSKYRGVSRKKNRFQACIRIRGTRYYLGLFKTPEEAENAYFEAKARAVDGN